MSIKEEKKDGVLGLLLTLLLLALIAAGVYYLFGTGESKNMEEHTTVAAEVKHEETDSVKPAMMEMSKESLKVKLINGTEIDAYKGGIEDKLVAFLNTDGFVA